MPELQGKRVADDVNWFDLEPGQYHKVTPPDGESYFSAKTPNGHACNLRGHDVTEHEDGTITVEPSIRVSNHTGELFHGWLRARVWSW